MVSKFTLSALSRTTFLKMCVSPWTIDKHSLYSMAVNYKRVWSMQHEKAEAACREGTRSLMHIR